MVASPSHVSETVRDPSTFETPYFFFFVLKLFQRF